MLLFFFLIEGTSLKYYSIAIKIYVSILGGSTASTRPMHIHTGIGVSILHLKITQTQKSVLKME